MPTPLHAMHRAKASHPEGSEPSCLKHCGSSWDSMVDAGNELGADSRLQLMGSYSYLGALYSTDVGDLVGVLVKMDGNA